MSKPTREESRPQKHASRALGEASSGPSLAAFVDLMPTAELEAGHDE